MNPEKSSPVWPATDDEDTDIARRLIQADGYVVIGNPHPQKLPVSFTWRGHRLTAIAETTLADAERQCALVGRGVKRHLKYWYKCITD